MGVLDAGGPRPECGGDRVLQRAGPLVHGHDLRAQQPHPVHVQRLPLRVLPAHVDHALHAHQRRGGGGGHAVLPRAGLGDQAGLAHLLRQQRLTEHIVDLVGAGVVEILPLEIDLRAAQIPGHLLRAVQAAGPPSVIVQQRRQLALERGIIFITVIRLLQLRDSVHQRLGDVLPSVDAEAPLSLFHVKCLLCVWTEKNRP